MTTQNKQNKHKLFLHPTQIYLSSPPGNDGFSRVRRTFLALFTLTVCDFYYQCYTLGQFRQKASSLALFIPGYLLVNKYMRISLNKKCSIRWLFFSIDNQFHTTHLTYSNFDSMLDSSLRQSN